MGEIAEDCYNRAMDEMFDGCLDVFEPIYHYRSQRPASRPTIVVTADDFDVVPNDVAFDPTNVEDLV